MSQLISELPDVCLFPDLPLSPTLTYKLSHRWLCVTQEELERRQEFGGVLQSLERNLELWQERLQEEARTADQVSPVYEPTQRRLLDKGADLRSVSSLYLTLILCRTCCCERVKRERLDCL